VRCADLIGAIGIPSGARVDQRVPKKLLVENGAPTTADKRKINDGVEELFWLATFKPTTIGVPELRDATRDYLEIALLQVELRRNAPGSRLATLIHRAVPYPVLLISTQCDALTISLAHKRRSQSEPTAAVLDGAPVVADLRDSQSPDTNAAFKDEMAIARQPRADLLALYQGWINTVEALLAAQVTGTFVVARSPEKAAARRTALAECERLEEQIGRLRAAAAKERQVARQVELNLETKSLRAALAVAQTKL
jgi:hypothetical protein